MPPIFSVPETQYRNMPAAFDRRRARAAIVQACAEAIGPVPAEFSWRRFEVLNSLNANVIPMNRKFNWRPFAVIAPRRSRQVNRLEAKFHFLRVLRRRLFTCATF